MSDCTYRHTYANVSGYPSRTTSSGHVPRRVASDCCLDSLDFSDPLAPLVVL